MITIKSVIDVAAVLDTQALDNNLYLYDSNRRSGSKREGTSQLATAVKKGDRIAWVMAPLECEIYTEIVQIGIPSAICEVVSHVFPGTNIVYWTGTVKKAITDEIKYSITYGLGPTRLQVATVEGPSLVPLTIS